MRRALILCLLLVCLIGGAAFFYISYYYEKEIPAAAPSIETESSAGTSESNEIAQIEPPKNQAKTSETPAGLLEKESEDRSELTTAESAIKRLTDSYLGGVATGNRSQIVNVWRWFLSHPDAPDRDKVLRELLQTTPVEIAYDLRSHFRSMTTSERQDVLASFADMLRESTRSDPGEGPLADAQTRKELIEFLEANTISPGEIRAYAFDAILGGGGPVQGTYDDEKFRVFQRFIGLSPQERSALYPIATTGIPPDEFWADKAVEYCFSLGDSQSKAIDGLLSITGISDKANTAIAQELSKELKAEGAHSYESGDGHSVAPDSVVLTKASKRIIAQRVGR